MPHSADDDAAAAAAAAAPLSPARRSRSHAPLLTPASAMVPHLHMLSLTTPRPALFRTPLTRDAGAPPAAAASAAACAASSFLTPPAADAASATPTRTPARGKQGFSSPQAAKARPRGHARAHSALSSSSFAGSSAALAAASAAAASSSSSGLRSSRPVSSRLQWDSTPMTDARSRSGAAAAAAAATGSEYSSDDATASERERNEKKMGRRINRGTTQGEKVNSTHNAQACQSLCWVPAAAVRLPACLSAWLAACLYLRVPECCLCAVVPCVFSSRRLLAAQTPLTRRAPHDATSRRATPRC